MRCPPFLISVVREKRLSQRRIERCLPRRSQRRVTRLLKESIDEPVTDRKFAVRQLLFANRIDQPVHFVKIVEAFFHIFGIHLHRRGEYGGIELAALNAGRHQKVPVGIIEPVEFRFDQIVNDLAAAVAMAQQFTNEQGVALGLGVHKFDVIVGEPGVRGEQRQILFDLCFAKKRD